MTPSLVLIHGWGMAPRVWNGLRICLSPRRVVAPALPGHAGRPAVAASLEAWGDALLEDLPENAVLCGWSLGGLIALDLARRHPERVARLILFGTSPCFVARDADAPSGQWPHGLSPDTVAGFEEGFSTDPAGTLRRFLALQALGETRRRGVVHALSGALTDTGAGARSALADGLALLSGTDYRRHAPSIAQPTLLLHGRDDALMTVGAAEWLARQLPAARLETFSDCGHAPFLSRPESCAQLIEEVLRD